MKSETLLDSAVFQLTPTRTRCDLVIVANGKSEKIASGLLNPFLANLKTAQDQIAKGGYSITLEPDPQNDATWFTKGTIERFVRFVSTPEVLERVNTIESEILQIEQAITIQSNENLGLGTVDDHQAGTTESIEGSKSVFDADAEKAIVLFKPGVHPPESNGSTTQEENSKVQLLRVLETRKAVLQKEQGMAFARAVAAGFDMDQMTYLISFADCFGASRLMEACLRFMELWKGKHETGQWLEIEAAEAMSSRSEFSALNASGIILSSETRMGAEFSGKTSNGTSADTNDQHLSLEHDRDKMPPVDSQVPLGPHDYFQGQFQHTMYPQWPIQSPPGAPVFQPYPMQGMPYYPNYPGSGPYFQPSYPPMEDSRFNATQRMGLKRHSMDSKDSNVESEIWETSYSNPRSQDGADQTTAELEKEVLQSREFQKKVGRSGKKQPGMVVIRNINYITSKKHNTSGSESQSASDQDSDEGDEDFQSDPLARKHKNSVRSSKNKGNHTKSTDTWNPHEKDAMVYGQEADGENWKAFQNFLLRDDKESPVDKGMFSGEKDAYIKRRHSTAAADPILPPERGLGDNPDQRITEFDAVSGNVTRIPKQKVSNDELVISREGFSSLEGSGSRDSQLGVQFVETEAGRGGYRRVADDDFMIYGRENLSGSMNSLPVPLVGHEFPLADNLEKSFSHYVTDESFILPSRSTVQDQVGTDGRTAIDIESELPLALQRTEDSSSKIRSQLSYEPDDLSLMPERGVERESIGYDPSVEYEMQVRVEDAVVVLNGNQDDVGTGVKEESKKLDKEKKSRIQRDGLEKRKMEATLKKGKPSKLSPLAEAQVRAERLRAYKADLQKAKKEKEEEDIKRLEALKKERQKRIAARGNSSPAQSQLSSQQTKSPLPTKLSPGSLKGSKFSDSEAGSSSPVQKLPIKTASVGSNDSRKTTNTKPTRLNSVHLAGNGLSRSVSSLPDLKKENSVLVSEPKAASARIKRLSEPKGSISHSASSLKSGSSNPVPKRKASEDPEIKKINAIMTLDKTKSATLPELKIRTSSGPSDVVQNKSRTKEIMQKGNGSRSSLTSESTKPKKTSEKTSHLTNGDDNLVIEKTVVVLEQEMPPAPIVQASEEMRKESDDADTGGKTEAVSEYAAIHAPASPITISEVDKDPTEQQLDERPNPHEVAIDYARDELQKFPSINMAKKPYQAPYARASSLEDPCTSNLEYSKAPPIRSEVAIIPEIVKAHISDPNTSEQIPEASDKPQGKESSKGFRRLLKFGRKNHSSAAGDRTVESDKLNFDTSVVDETASSANEVHTLKNLISQDDSPTGGMPQKVSRPFSLLSPFRSKTSEKKLTT